MGVVARKTFSHTPDEAMSDGLAKACGLGKMYSVKENISHFKERRGLAQLKKDKDRLVLTADKGVAMIVMDKEDYIHKAEDLLGQPAYRILDQDLTNRIKDKLITKLRTINETRLDEGTYKIMYTTGCVTPKFYGLPKIHKTGTPLRPIVSSKGSVTYGRAKVLSKVFKPLVGKSTHHVKSTSDFVNKAKEITLQPVECLTSYDVTALFTSVPIEPALKIIRYLLEKDDRLQDRTVLSVQHIIDLLGFCLHNTYFSFQNEIYEQVEGAVMGSLVSPIVANLYMEHFEREAPSLPLIPPGIGLGLWMAHGSFNKVPINKNFSSISIALIQQSSLQLKALKEMEASLSLTP